MILTEYLNDGTLIKHYSDQNFLLLQNETGMKYHEAIDVVPCPYTYTETNEVDETDEAVDGDEATVEDYQDILGEFGVAL